MPKIVAHRQRQLEGLVRNTWGMLGSLVNRMKSILQGVTGALTIAPRCANPSPWVRKLWYILPAYAISKKWNP